MRISNAEQEGGKSMGRNGTNEGTEVRFYMRLLTGE